MRWLLATAEQQRLTGIVRVSSWGRAGIIELQRGAVAAASFGNLRGEQALAELTSLRDGMFELVHHDTGRRGETDRDGITRARARSTSARAGRAASGSRAGPEPVRRTTASRPPPVPPVPLRVAAACHRPDARPELRPLTAPRCGPPRTLTTIGLCLLGLTLLVGVVATQL